MPRGANALYVVTSDKHSLVFKVPSRPRVAVRSPHNAKPSSLVQSILMQSKMKLRTGSGSARCRCSLRGSGSRRGETRPKQNPITPAPQVICHDTCTFEEVYGVRFRVMTRPIEPPPPPPETFSEKGGGGRRSGLSSRIMSRCAYSLCRVYD
jgi:hypothetical protein